MRLLAGLGNPGSAYDGTRHNIGFAVVDEVARRLGAPAFRSQKKNLLTRLRLKHGEECLLVLPQTFMNLSGEGIGPLVRFYKLSAADVLVVHDELDFALGKNRFKERGGHGGHNGLRSLLEHVPGDFARLRVGIGALGARSKQVEFVLARFAPDEQAMVQKSIEQAADACIWALHEGLVAATRRLHAEAVPRDAAQPSTKKGTP